ncbi:hypothetical protein Hanom_Chr08g00721541 [Helianthus anomalus]
MLSRVLSKPSTLRFITLISSSHPHYKPPIPHSSKTLPPSPPYSHSTPAISPPIMETTTTITKTVLKPPIPRTFRRKASTEKTSRESEGRVEGFNEWKIIGGDEKDGYEIFDSGDAGLSELAGIDGNLHILDEKAEALKKEEDRKLEIEEKDLLEVLKGICYTF